MLPESGAGDTAPGRTQSLYRKHRPETFEETELVGQDHVSRTLRNAVRTGRVAHAYLFCGPRGTGKTTTARLLAKAVNCLDADPQKRPCNECEACVAINESRATDIIEIDAASNRSIDDMRNLREQVRYAPTQLRTKFYIIDEAHQLTREAFNAFLKTLEEPPPNTAFVLATTDPDKLPETIASRCQRYDFHRIPRDSMIARVTAVCEREGIGIDDDALDIVVRRSTGSLRDALSLIDMLSTAAGESDNGRITADLTLRMLGISIDGFELDVIQALADRDIASGLAAIGQAVDAGQDMRGFGRQIIELLRLMLLSRAGANPVEATERIRELAQRFELHDLLRINEHFSDVDFKIRNGGFPQLPLELALVASLVEPAAGGAASVAVNERPPRMEAPSRPTPERQGHSSRPGGVERRGRAEPTPIRQARPEPVAAPTPPPARAAVPAATGAGVEVFISNWERIRTEVKAIDRKAEALLASTDPARIDGDTLILIAAYPFHAQKLSEPKIRSIVEDSIERVTGRVVHASFQLRDDPLAAPPAQASAREAGDSDWGYDASVTPRSSNGVTSVPSVPAEPEEPSADEQRVRSAKAIFDAEEVNPDDILPPR